MSVRSLPSALSCAALCVTTAAVATAQAPAPAPPPAGRFFLGAGLDPLARGLGGTQSDLALQGGYARQLGASRFGLRVEGTYRRHRSRYTTFGFDPAAALGATQTVTLLGAGVAGTYQFAPSGRVRPYALAGLGLQQYAAPAETDRDADGIIHVFPSGRRNLLTPALGLGLDVPLGRGALFVEGRVVALPGTSGLNRRGTTPLTVGLRF